MVLEQRVQPMYNIGMKLTLKYKDPAYVHSLPCVCTCEVIGSLCSETNSMQQQTNKQKNVLKTLRPLVDSLWTINLDFVSKQMIHEEQRKHCLAQNIDPSKCNSESVKCKRKNWNLKQCNITESPSTSWICKIDVKKMKIFGSNALRPKNFSQIWNSWWKTP